MSSAPPKRCDIEYKYAVGIALKNKQPLRAKDVYDVIKVHMPTVCTYHNNNWENAVRTCLTSSGLFEKVNLTKTLHEKPAWTYKFKEGAIEEFNQKFPFDYGAPYTFLTKPELHQKLYNGELGYPTKEEIRTARAIFDEEKKRWAGYKKEKKEKTEKKTTKKVVSTGTPSLQYSGIPTVQSNGCDAQNEIQITTVLAPIQNQMLPPQNGQYAVNAPGPIRSQLSSTAWSRLTPYQRQNQAVRRKPAPQTQQSPQIPQLAQMPQQEHGNVENNQENVQPVSTAWTRLTAKQLQNQIVRPKPLGQMEESLQAPPMNQGSQLSQQPLQQGSVAIPSPVVQQPMYSEKYYQNSMPYYQNQVLWTEPMFPMEQGPQPIQMVPNQHAEPTAEYHQSAQNLVQLEEFPVEAPEVVQEAADIEEDLADLFGIDFVPLEIPSDCLHFNFDNIENVPFPGNFDFHVNF